MKTYMNEFGTMKEHSNGEWVRVEVAEQLQELVKHERENAAIRVAQFHADYAKDISIGAVKAAMGEK